MGGEVGRREGGEGAVNTFSRSINLCRVINFILFFLETPVYLIPIIAGLVVVAAFVLLVVVICERRRRKQRKRNRRQAYEETAKLKRRDSEDGVETASEASRGLRKEGSFTELRDIEPEEIDVSVIGPSERTVSRSSIEVLSPARSPREHGARDEWRRKEILSLQRKSSKEIIV
jgi:hypothetical protein